VDTQNEEYLKSFKHNGVSVSKENKNSKYTKEFKVEAIRLAKESGSVTKTAKDLGISNQVLYAWISQYQQNPLQAFPGHGKLKPEDEELRRLRLEIKHLKETNEILKKAASYFAIHVK
jgi:transposase